MMAPVKVLASHLLLESVMALAMVPMKVLATDWKLYITKLCTNTSNVCFYVLLCTMSTNVIR